MSRAELPEAVRRFAVEVGDQGPVTVVGGRTQYDVGGPVDPAAREVAAPAGVWEYEPSEMTVRCGAGTTLAELEDVLSAHGQMVPFDANPAATVGGLLAVGRSGHRRLRYGHIRDLVLQTRHVDAAGQVVMAGGPTVKNVSGYDLARLLVGSLGTLGFLAEVILRCLPQPEVSTWFRGQSVDPFEVRDALYRPSSVLWDGTTTWVLLEGHGGDVAAEAATAAMASFEPCDPPLPLPNGERLSLRPSQLRQLAGVEAHPSGRWVAEVGVGVVRCDRSVPAEMPTAEQPSPANIALMGEIRSRLDPTGRLNPGRQPW